MAGSMPNLLTGIVPVETAHAAMATPQCVAADLFGATSLEARNCRVEGLDKMTYLSMIGPCDFGCGKMVDFYYNDIFGLKETMQERDVLAQSFFTAPMDATGTMLKYPPVNVQHLVVWVTEPNT